MAVRFCPGVLVLPFLSGFPWGNRCTTSRPCRLLRRHGLRLPPDGGVFFYPSLEVSRWETGTRCFSAFHLFFAVVSSVTRLSTGSEKTRPAAAADAALFYPSCKVSRGETGAQPPSLAVFLTKDTASSCRLMAVGLTSVLSTPAIMFITMLIPVFFITICLHGFYRNLAIQDGEPKNAKFLYIGVLQNTGLSMWDIGINLILARL